MMGAMVERVLAGGLLAAAVALGAPGAAAGEEPSAPPARSVIMELTNRPIESQEQALREAIKADAQAPAPSPIEMWEAQPDGSMRHKKTGITVIVRNPCPPGDIEHEFALAAYNRAMARSRPGR
jgi:hypothetical protein